MKKRIFEAEIMQEIQDRWSPRAFSPEPLPDGALAALLEAARYAPSCFNEQPWRFIVADDHKKKEKMLGLLNEQNRIWAARAPVLLMVLAKKTFEKNGKENYWHMFDAGTAWGFLSLEAQRRGLITHAMGGFSRKASAEAYGLDETVVPIAVVAVGRYGDPNDLPDDLREREHPEIRKDVRQLLFHG